MFRYVVELQPTNSRTEHSSSWSTATRELFDRGSRGQGNGQRGTVCLHMLWNGLPVNIRIRAKELTALLLFSGSDDAAAAIRQN